MATIVTEISSNTLFTILFLLPLIYLIAKQLKTLYSSRFAPLPPGPYSWPILGNALQIGNSPHITLASLAKTYGPLFSLRLGSQLVIVAASQEAATEILKTQDRFLSGRFVPDVIPAKWLKLENLSLGWIGEVNNEFKFLRTVCQSKLFSNKALLSQSCLREKKAADTVRFIRTMEGKVLKIKKVAFAAVFSMLTNILISSDLISMEQESMEGEMTEIIRNIFEVGAAPNISDLFPVLAPFDLQNLRKKSKELYLRFSTMFEAIIEERRERKMSSDNASGKEDFLDTLISNGSSNEHINVLLLELLVAGSDTSTSAIEWAMAELLRNPQCMKKAQAELASEINQDLIQESDLPRLKFLHACLKESMRLHPPGPLLLPHRAVNSCKVMGYTIPKNSQVLVNAYAIGRDPKSWKDPLDYKPERFLTSNMDFRGSNIEFIPFGAGRRACPGQPMATKHVPLVLASLLHFFDWSLPTGHDPKDIDMTDKFHTSLQKEQPLLLIPKIKN